MDYLKSLNVDKLIERFENKHIDLDQLSTDERKNLYLQEIEEVVNLYLQEIEGVVNRAKANNIQLAGYILALEKKLNSKEVEEVKRVNFNYTLGDK